MRRTLIRVGKRTRTTWSDTVGSRPRNPTIAKHHQGAISMTMSVARNAWVSPGAVGNDGLTELEARKRRIIRRGAIGNAASPATHAALAEAGTIQRVSKGRLLI